MTDETIDKNLEVLEREAKKCFESAEILHNKVKAIYAAWEEWHKLPFFFRWFKKEPYVSTHERCTIADNYGVSQSFYERCKKRNTDTLLGFMGDPLVDRLIRNNLPSDLVAKMEKERLSMYGG